MMFERFTVESRTVVVHAQEHARRLGHRHIGCEHLLLAAASTEQPASAVLREQGVTPEHVEEEIVRLVGLGGETGLFGDLDRDALSVIGIDLDAVRARIESSFGTDALTEAAIGVQHGERRYRWNPGRGIPSLVRRRRRRQARKQAAEVTATGRYQATGAIVRGHLPFTTGAKKALENSLREAAGRHDNYIGAEHLVLGLIRTNGGLMHQILLALDASGPEIRTAIINRYRKAS
jgi:ATP-dependent Clp protease ATP-binding subunit ClpA